MRPHGRYLRFRHVMPELFLPGVQARRGILRLRWFLLQRLDFRPIWTLGAAAGLGGVLLTVSLFFLQGNLRTAIAARVPVQIEPITPQPPVVVPPYPEPIVAPAVSALQPYLAPQWMRLAFPFGWDDRRLFTARSIPQAVEPTTPLAFNRNDLWARASFRATPLSTLQAFVPYREPAGLRPFGVTPEVRVSDVVSSAAGTKPLARPTATIEKQMPTAHSGVGALEYRLVVTNPTANPLPEVSVFEAVDVARVTAANPPAQVEPTGLVWKLHGLAPGERRELSVTVWMEGLAALAVATDVELADRVSAVVHIDGQTTEPFFERNPTPALVPTTPALPAFPREADLPPFPRLDVTPPAPAPGPPSSLPAFPALPANPPPAAPAGRPLLKLTSEPPVTVAVGEDATTWYEIENIGDAPAEHIVLSLKLPDGLLHHEGSQDVEFTVVRLEPGEKRRARLVIRVVTHGSYEVSGQLTAGEQRESSTVLLFAPQKTAVAGDGATQSEPHDGQSSPFQCTLLVRRTRVAR